MLLPSQMFCPAVPPGRARPSPREGALVKSHANPIGPRVSVLHTETTVYCAHPGSGASLVSSPRMEASHA